MGRYQSLVSLRVQRLQDALTGADHGSENRFGQFSDMAALERDLRARADARLAVAAGGSGARSSWFGRLVDMLQSRGTRVVVLELPMPGAYRRSISETARALDYRRARSRPACPPALRTSISRAPWVDDALFADALHLNARGAAHLSRSLGDALPAADL